MRDPHQVIIHHVREVIGGEAVGFEQHLVVDHIIVDGDLFADQVAEMQLSSERHLHADRMWHAGSELLLDVRLAECAAAAVVARVFFLFLLPGTGGREFIGSAEAAVGLALVQQLLRVSPVDVRAFRLHVRSVPAALFGSLVEAQAGPAQRVYQVFHRSFDVAGAVGVLDTQDGAAAMPAREQVIIESRTESPDMKEAGGTGGETDANGILIHTGSADGDTEHQI